MRTLTRPLVAYNKVNGDEPNGVKSDAKLNGETKDSEPNGDPNGEMKDGEPNGELKDCGPKDSEMKDSETNSEHNGGVDDDKLMWTPELLQDAMRHVYQRVLFEHVHDIQDIAVQVSTEL